MTKVGKIPENSGLFLLEGFPKPLDVGMAVWLAGPGLDVGQVLHLQPRHVPIKVLPHAVWEVVVAVNERSVTENFVHSFLHIIPRARTSWRFNVGVRVILCHIDTAKDSRNV